MGSGHNQPFYSDVAYLLDVSRIHDEEPQNEFAKAAEILMVGLEPVNENPTWLQWEGTV